ncbi:gamma carbonic anhydrase family protein [Methanobrevibacter curvatus]|uniref:2,3,4,5-tetrahydropyridine-2,6-dicarboxylate N-acetyltransferase n=1 Tax=Methanobrevibacter curvatus TaxID=49547 RepID=A0A166CN16_9EURY|nr:gamma carbonic anhydrase family protein [Methanobrevibacter curvatus]KZX14682.1 2,3,4,5-tetrahydropyridine-2,6-dicarboxylate N-acetyltransferase [Methanobrevibacter curvatus]
MIDNSAKIFPGAHIIGDVDIGENSSVWYNAVVRGDRGKIIIGKNSNVQDNCVLHGSLDMDTVINDNVSIGHGAIIHGCLIEDNVLVGMNATVLNNAKISKNSIVGAGALVSENKEFPEGSLILGVPGKFIRKLTPEEIKGVGLNAKEYVNLAKEYYI